MYLVPTQTSMVKFFAKIVNDSVKAVNYFRKKNFILDAWLGSKYTFPSVLRSQVFQSGQLFGLILRESGNSTLAWFFH